MANTTNYNWETPDDTDLVKDGAAAIRTLGNSIDTTTKNLNPQTTTGALAYRSATANVNTALPIGTANQVLRVNSGGTAPEWATTADQTPLTTKGDLFGFDTADARIPIGTNGHILTCDSTQSLGLKWAAPSSPTFTSYTPSWTNLTVGNGTVTAVSATNGDLVSVVVKIVFGSTTSVSGLIKYSLPATAHSSIYLCEFPGGLMLDSGSYYTECHTRIDDSGTNGAIVWNNINEGATAQNFPVQSNTSSSLPWTWATSDQIVSAFTYRKA